MRRSSPLLLGFALFACSDRLASSGSESSTTETSTSSTTSTTETSTTETSTTETSTETSTESSSTTASTWEPDPTDECLYACDADPNTAITDCAGPISLAPIEATTMTGIIDMGEFQELRLSFEVCAPTGWVLHLSDSDSTNGWGGDNGTFSNDAELHLLDTSFEVYRSDMCNDDPLVHQTYPFVDASGCTTRTLVLADQALWVEEPALSLSYSCLLRIDPPTDTEGLPDALWYVGLNRTYGDGSRSGIGLQSASFCLR